MYAVKVGIREGTHTEYFWINEFVQKGGAFTGRLNNQPRVVKQVRYGQPYTFTKAQIVDWTYVDEKAKRMFGNYTACALLSKEPPEEAAAMKEQYGLTCD